MTTVLYSCPFVPAEWIAAHGLCPQQVTPQVQARSSRLFPEPGICPYAASFAEHVARAGERTAAIFTSKCDQMRRIYDLARTRCKAPMFMFNLPTVTHTPVAEQMYVSELQRMGRFLEQVGGTPPTDGWQPVCVPGRQNCSPRKSDCLVRLAIAGGPLSKDSPFVAQVRRCGADVVFDASETGEAMRHAPIDPYRWTEDPLRELSRVYLNMPSVHQRPNADFYAWMRDCIREQAVAGLILRRYVWCDLWHGEARRLAEELDLPVLHLEVEADTPADSARNETRIGAFIEMLQHRNAYAANK
jgi:benzoyl-CoA reductase/2-hydroxyglutaryl-CoA dehydratase subunit BcrC/BadD/HgdB